MSMYGLIPFHAFCQEHTQRIHERADERPLQNAFCLQVMAINYPTTWGISCSSSNIPAGKGNIRRCQEHHTVYATDNQRKAQRNAVKRRTAAQKRAEPRIRKED